jgi:hypothetical protein
MGGVVMACRVVTTKIVAEEDGYRLGYIYEVLDERGVVRCSGWTRGTEERATVEATKQATELGLVVAQ